MPNSHFLASAFVERIEKHIEDLEKKIKGNERISRILVLNDGSKVYPNSYSYHNPNMVKIYGNDEEGYDVEVLLHQNSVQLIFRIEEKIN